MISTNDLPQGFFSDLVDLISVFQPENFRRYENNPAARDRLAQMLRTFMGKLSELAPLTRHPNLEILNSLPDTLSQEEYITLLYFYLRLFVSQGGAETFIRLWKNGTALTLVKRLQQITEAKRYPVVTLISDSVFLGARWCCYKLEERYDFVKLFASKYPFPPSIKVYDDADVGMCGFSEDFYTFEEYFEWYHQNRSKCGIVSYTWTDLTEIKIENDTVYFRTFKTDMDMNTFLAGLREYDKPLPIPVPELKKEPASDPGMTADPAVFTPAEKAALISHLEQYMGTEPMECGWGLSIKGFDSRVVWYSWYSVDGFNYCAEDEYNVSVTFSPERRSIPVPGFQRLEENAPLYRTRYLDQYTINLTRLVNSLRTKAKTVWVKDNGAHEEPDDPLTYYSDDLELVFEGVMPGGRNIHLYYCNSRTAPF